MKSLSSSLKDLIHSWSQMQSAVHLVADGNKAFPKIIKGMQGSSFSFFLNELEKTVYYTNLQAIQYNNAKRYTEEKLDTFSNDLVIIVPGELEARNLYNDLITILENTEIYIFPAFSSIPYRAAAPGSVVFGKRAGVLAKILDKTNLITTKSFRIFIFTQRSFITPVPAPDSLKNVSLSLNKKDIFDTTKISQKLIQMGYIRVSKVAAKGEFSLRGEVLDIYLPLDENPTRITFDFDQIESFKEFEVDSQTTLKSKENIFIYPMKEVIWNEDLISTLENKLTEYQESAILQNDSDSTYEASTILSAKSIHLPFTQQALTYQNQMLEELKTKGSSEGEELFYHFIWDKQYSVKDYFSDNTLFLFFDHDRLCNSEIAINREFMGMYRKTREELPVLPPDLIKFNFENLQKQCLDSIFFKTINTNIEQENTVSDISDSNNEEKSPESENSVNQNPSIIQLDMEPARSFFGNLTFMKEELDKLKADKWNVYIYADNENQKLRINEIFKEYTNPEDKNIIPLKLIPQAITAGFIIPEIKLLVIQENEIFGRRKYIPKSLNKSKSQPIDTFVELNPGDYVVHVNWGIGLFHGIERVKAMGNERDYIKLEYADEEYALVPIEQVNLVQRYIGNEGDKPKLDRIGSKAWENRKSKVQKAVEDLAQKLIDLYSRRKASAGFAFPKETEWQSAFEAVFPYEDTPDQITVTEEVKADMEKPVPMDRLVCGDVGYGKTEIAMRAAFKAVMGGKQVAFLAPTTILAEQHYDTCIERFKNFPVKIARLSRFVSPAEQKKILFKLMMGEVDILVGTHRIIQKDVKFKNLGLMIIDEEQRFGVKDKEKLKTIKNNIDCLTLSATPIPRTLHMSLLKIRDMSLLTTPPQNRQPIETVIDHYSDEKIAQAIRRELERDGQVFYLHNRIETLMEVRKKVEQIVPEVLVDTAHGQMTSTELDDIFHRFKMGGFHVLIATTIIENGIDIPNVNTIIIDRADMYGVSQLYQLRGRVGRSDRQAYAYLFYPQNKSLSEVAMKRLQVISDFTELGSGFKIAMKDMEIRGAGNLLGKDQSGDVCSVGFDLYVKLLNDAVNRLMNQKDYKAENEVLMELEYSGFIPDSYVSNPQIKMEIYKKIASITTQAEFDGVLSELNDRFGPIPDEVSSLLALAEIRIICHRLNITRIIEQKNEVKIIFSSVSNIAIDKILKLIKDNPGTIRINPVGEQAIFIKLGKIGLKEKSEFIREKLSQLL